MMLFCDSVATSVNNRKKLIEIIDKQQRNKMSAKRKWNKSAEEKPNVKTQSIYRPYPPSYVVTADVL